MANPSGGLPSLETTEDEKKEQGFLANAPKSKGLTPAGQIAMDPRQTADLLANMQTMVDERSGAFNTFMGGLKDASAWGSGGEKGPSAALALREEAKNKEYKDVYDMRTQMAAYRAAQAQQEAYNEEQKRIFGGGGAGTGGAGTGGAGGMGTGAPQMYKGVMLDPETAVAMAQARSREDRDKIFNDFASKRSQARGSFEFGAPSYKNDIKFVTPEGKLEYIDAVTAKRYKDEGYGKVLGPSATQGYRPAAAGSVPPEAIREVESGGRPGLVSSAGAEGTMQVMPNTQTDPGFGVIPAKDKSQAELERVGRDYYAAMQKQYGNDTLASIAYNMGPGATDSWLKKGGNFKDLPAETRDYIGQVHLATAKLNRAGNTGAAPSAAPGRQLTIPEAEAKAAGQKSRAEAQGTAAGKYLGGAEATVREASSSSGERLSSLDYLDGLINNPKTSRVFGVFEHPDFASAIGKVVDNGIKLGRLGDVGVDLAPIVRSVMKNASQEEIDAVQKATREFAKIKLNEAKILLAGQGAVSDAERGLVQELSGSIKNSPGALRDYLAWGKMRAEYDRGMGAAFKEYRRTNRGASFEDFLDTGKADELRDVYDEKLFDFARKTGIDMSKAAADGAKQLQDQAKPKTAPMTYSDPEKEKRYQLYLQQNRGTK
jgi:hypothetical protein